MTALVLLVSKYRSTQQDVDHFHILQRGLEKEEAATVNW